MEDTVRRILEEVGEQLELFLQVWELRRRDGSDSKNQRRQICPQFINSLDRQKSRALLNVLRDGLYALMSRMAPPGHATKEFQ